MNLQEKYITVGLKYIPSAEREAVAKAMRQIIAERLAERGNASEESEREVLRSLGHPRLLAEKQLSQPLYLVGPELYGTYMLIVKIIVIIAVVGTLLGHTIDFIVNNGSLLGYFAETLGAAISAAIGALGGVTLLFAILERTAKQKVIQEIQDDWNLADLPMEELPLKPFSRIGVIIGLIFTLLFMILINRYNHLFGFYYQTGGEWKIIPLLNSAVLATYLPYINGMFMLQLLFTASKLIFRTWTFPVAITNLLLNVLAFALIWIILSDSTLLNPAILEKISEVTGETLVFEHIITGFKVFFVFLFLFDSIDGFRIAYKNRQ